MSSSQTEGGIRRGFGEGLPETAAEEDPVAPDEIIHYKSPAETDLMRRVK